MIRYENVDRDDMIRYWGRGLVFLPHTLGGREYWNGYSIKDVGESRVMLKHDKNCGKFGEPDEKVSLTMTRFFEQVMLHRPPLGVLVRDGGEVILLSWYHADGNDLCKAIRGDDVRVECIRKPEKPGEDEPPSWDTWFADHMAQIWDVYRRLDFDRSPYAPRPVENCRVIRESYTSHPDLPKMPGADPRKGKAVGYVLEFLNQRAVPLKEAAKQNPDHPIYLGGPAWLCPQRNGTFDLMTGPHKVGEIARPSGTFVCPKGNKVRGLIGQKLYQTLT